MAAKNKDIPDSSGREGVIAVNDRIFPTIHIIVSIAAAAVYWTKGDIRKIIYWLAAAALTTVVTY